MTYIYVPLINYFIVFYLLKRNQSPNHMPCERKKKNLMINTGKQLD